MPPHKNPAHQNAKLQFMCDTCSKGYARQPDYEHHLRSYDHTHLQRIADLKKVTAQNEMESKNKKRNEKKRGPEEMHSLPRVTKLGGDSGGPRFKKVGVAVGSTNKTGQVNKDPSEKTEISPYLQPTDIKEEHREQTGAEEITAKGKKDRGVAMMATSGDEYDFTKPTGCNWSCAALKTTGIWSDSENSEAESKRKRKEADDDDPDIDRISWLMSKVPKIKQCPSVPGSSRLFHSAFFGDKT